MFDIDLQSRMPIYEQIYKKIVELVIKNELKPNDKLPSVRELAKSIGINPNTVSKAFQMLEHDKIIYSLAGRGSFIAMTMPDNMKDKAFDDFDNAVREAIIVGISKNELVERIGGIEV